LKRADRSRISRPTRHDARAAYRDAIANMTADRMIELEPDAGESLRGLKLNVTRAAKEVNRDVAYGVTDEGVLLVWLEKPKQTRRRRKTVAAG
jgi:hypothetical protein